VVTVFISSSPVLLSGTFRVRNISAARKIRSNEMKDAAGDFFNFAKKIQYLTALEPPLKKELAQVTYALASAVKTAVHGFFLPMFSCFGSTA